MPCTLPVVKISEPIGWLRPFWRKQYKGKEREAEKVIGRPHQKWTGLGKDKNGEIQSTDNMWFPSDPTD